MLSRATKGLLVILFLSGLAGPSVLAQDASPTASQSSSSQKNGTGVVPPGVKLGPEMPAPAAPRAFEFPQAATKRLSNGLSVYVISDHREPAIAVRLVVLSAGTIKDPAGMPGVAEMTANLLTQGTEKRSARDIAETIDFVGGTLDASAGKDSTAVTLSVVKKDMDAGLDLMSDIVLHPSFRAEELERQRQQLLSNLTVQYSDPEYLASVVFDRALYGNSPYGLPGEGTPESAKELTRDVITKFHAENYVPNQALIAFSGDITPEQAFAAAQKYFGAWPRNETATPIPPTPVAPEGWHIWLIDKPDAVQTQVRVGRLGIRRSDPDYIPVEVMNRIFGGGYNSRLNTEVRIKKGLTYGAYSSFDPHRYSGSFVVGTYTRTEATVEATKLVVDLIEKMSTGEVTPNELDFARDYLAGVYPIQSETATQVADRVLTAAMFELPADYNRTYPERIRRVTPEQVRAMSQRYLATSDLDMVLVGNASAFRDALKKVFPNAKYEEIPFGDVDVMAPGLRKPKEAAATPESIAKGKEILLEAVQAAGGGSLGSVNTLGMTETGKLNMSGSESPTVVKWLVAYPWRAHADVNLGGMNIVQICDGESAWVQVQSQLHDATPMLGEFERGISLFGGGWGLFQQVIAGKVSGQYLGEEEIEGKKTLGVAVSGSFGAVKLYFDPATHLLVAARYRSEGPQGASENEQEWSDYRPVEGRQFAYTTVIHRDGAKFLESTIQELSLNPKVDESLFAKPQVTPSK
jgi:zinc protease